jgi:hypothetical protein
MMESVRLLDYQSSILNVSKVISNSVSARKNSHKDKLIKYVLEWTIHIKKKRLFLLIYTGHVQSNTMQALCLFFF